MNILFVCSGNISRSFLAEILLKKEIEPLKTHSISVASAGLYAYPGNPPDRKMLDYLSKMGIPVKKHEAKQITRQDVDWADLILVMEKEHKTMLKELWPGIGGKVKRLGRFISEDQKTDDIIDPFGRTPYHYRLAQSQITLAIKNLVKSITSDQT
ncbi:MAG: low molecular weight protein arginine phosphatase [Deltaproteobacteria bacterium]|nr:low molecular weight protein arginine phosphatase [Deltaproteobacteria bacterium]